MFSVVTLTLFSTRLLGSLPSFPMLGVSLSGMLLRTIKS